MKLPRKAGVKATPAAPLAPSSEFKTPRGAVTSNPRTTPLKIPRSDKRYMSVSHKRSPLQENDLAIKLGGKLVRGSGCGYEVGDVHVEGIAKVECKNTLHQSFSVTRKMLAKISHGCKDKEVPAIQIDFLHPSGELDSSCYVIPTYAYDYLINRIHEIEKGR